MISSDTAVGFIARIVQANIHLGPAWDSLDPQPRQDFISRWKIFIRHYRESAAALIAEDIEAHPALGHAWRRGSETLRGHLPTYFEAIIRNAHGGNCE